MKSERTEASAPERYAEEQALVGAVIDGDALARRRLVRRYHRAIRQTVSFLSAARSGRVQPADVEDAVQQVFLAVFNDDAVVLRRWQARAGLKTYLCRIAERVAQRHFARALTRSGRFRLSLDAPDLSGEAQVDRLEEDALIGAESAQSLDQRLSTAEEILRVRAAIRERLSPRGRQFYAYLFEQELDVTTIAALEGTNANNVYQWKNRIARTALQVLRAEGYTP